MMLNLYPLTGNKDISARRYDIQVEIGRRYDSPFFIDNFVPEEPSTHTPFAPIRLGQVYGPRDC